MTSPDTPSATDEKPTYAIVHNEQAQQFELLLEGVADGDKAVAKYRRFAVHGDANSKPTGIAYTSVQVPATYKGKGVGTQLVRHILDYARTNSFTVDPVCPFVKAYMKRFPEYKPSSNLPTLE